jgi:ribosomal-protein-alanine N-acetyltransferase
MIINTSELNVRPAETNDRIELSNLIQRKSFVHRHLGWRSPLDWLGYQPFLVLEDNSKIVAALACPPDEDGITWLQLFVSAPGFATFRAWKELWPYAREILETSNNVTSLNSLVIHPEMERLLNNAGFSEIYHVVVLDWSNTEATWPEIDIDLVVRLLEEGDLEQVYEIDKLAFDEIWRNSLSQLKAAYKEAFSATVVEVDGVVQGYQISTATSLNGHLARLAVNPSFQSKGLGSVMVADLLERFQESGIVEVTVNTQSNNRASLELYEKFGFRLLDNRYPVRQYIF